MENLTIKHPSVRSLTSYKKSTVERILQQTSGSEKFTFNKKNLDFFLVEETFLIEVFNRVDFFIATGIHNT